MIAEAKAIPATRKSQRRRAAQAANYSDLAPNIERIAGWYAQRYHLQMDDVLPVAQDAFLKHEHRWERERHVTYSYWVAMKVHYALQTFIQRRTWKAAKHPPHCQLDDRLVDIVVPQIEGRMANLLRDLSDDARVVVQVVVDSVGEVRTPINDNLRRVAKQKLFAKLKEQFAWQVGRAMQAFAEVKEALEC